MDSDPDELVQTSSIAVSYNAAKIQSIVGNERRGKN